MNDIKRYSISALTEDILSDGSKVYGVFISGDYDIQFHCIYLDIRKVYLFKRSSGESILPVESTA